MSLRSQESLQHADRLRAAAMAQTPAPAEAWKRASPVKRVEQVVAVIGANPVFNAKGIAVLEARDDGQIIVRLKIKLSPGARGALLLDLEASLKSVIDPGLAVWHESLGDRNSLRNLRGIEIKS